MLNLTKITTNVIVFFVFLSSQVSHADVVKKNNRNTKNFAYYDDSKKIKSNYLDSKKAESHDEVHEDLEKKQLAKQSEKQQEELSEKQKNIDITILNSNDSTRNIKKNNEKKNNLDSKYTTGNDYKKIKAGDNNKKINNDKNDDRHRNFKSAADTSKPDDSSRLEVKNSSLQDKHSPERTLQDKDIKNYEDKNKEKNYQFSVNHNRTIEQTKELTRETAEEPTIEFKSKLINDVSLETERRKKIVDNLFNALDESQTNYISNKFFIKFDKQKALNVNYTNIEYTNFGFLENEEELKIIKRVLHEQQDPDLRKIHEEKERLRDSILDRINKKQLARVLRIYSLVFFNENDWSAKINHEVVNNLNKNVKTIFGAKVIRVNKTSIVFLITKSNQDIVEKVKVLKKKKVPYSDNYFLIKNNNKTYVAFKLFIGQKINLDTMHIKG